MLVDLKHDGLQDEGGGGDHVERLLGLRQPVDEVLQRVVEVGGLRQRLLQLDLPGGKKNQASGCHGAGQRRKVPDTTSVCTEEADISGEADSGPVASDDLLIQ